MRENVHWLSPWRFLPIYEDYRSHLDRIQLSGHLRDTNTTTRSSGGQNHFHSALQSTLSFFAWFASPRLTCFWCLNLLSNYPVFKTRSDCQAFKVLKAPRDEQIASYPKLSEVLRYLNCPIDWPKSIGRPSSDPSAIKMTKNISLSNSHPSSVIHNVRARFSQSPAHCSHFLACW